MLGALALLQFVLGAERPEDLARIPETKWVVASGFSRGAGLKLVDTDRKSLRFWLAGARWNHKRYPDCQTAPDPQEFNTQGISLRTGQGGRHTLYVVNHGRRESVEIYTIDARALEPTLTWNGCVLMPPGLVANSVASYSDGTILTTVLTHPGMTITDFVQGKTTGGVYEWKPGTSGFRLIPGTELPGNNGLETARDDTAFFVVAFGWRSVLMYARDDPSRPPRRAVAPGFMPDNIHWDGDRLIAAGMQFDEPACGGVRKLIDGKADDMRCHRGYSVARLDPDTMTFSLLAYSEPDPGFNGVSAAVIVDSTLWLGSYQVERIAYCEMP